MIAGIVTGIGCIAGIVVYFVKKTLLESLFSTLLGHLVLTDIKLSLIFRDQIDDHIKNDNDRDHDGCHSKSIRSTFRIIALK